VKFDAIVLAGGAARRLDGADKGALEVGHAPMLRRALDAVVEASSIVVVGPASNASLIADPDIVFVTEDPPRGGPAAAVAAGLASTRLDLVVVLACDMPFVHVATVRRLVEAAADSTDGAMLIDDAGRQQYLAAAYRAEPLRRALDALEPITNAALFRAVSALTVQEVPADPDEAFDVDTWADVERSRRRWEET